jgi:hypothetical protein
LGNLKTEGITSSYQIGDMIGMENGESDTVIKQ